MWFMASPLCHFIKKFKVININFYRCSYLFSQFLLTLKRHKTTQSQQKLDNKINECPFIVMINCSRLCASFDCMQFCLINIQIVSFVTFPSILLGLKEFIKL